MRTKDFFLKENIYFIPLSIENGIMKGLWKYIEIHWRFLYETNSNTKTKHAILKYIDFSDETHLNNVKT